MTETQFRALTYLRDHPKGVKAAEIAAYLWPDSVMHRKMSNQGHGACRGKAAWLCGGAYLQKLCKKKWAYWWSGIIDSGAYYLSDEGRKALAEAID